MARTTTKTTRHAKEHNALVEEMGPDTHGEALPEPTTTNAKKQKAKDKKFLEKKEASNYQGTLQASKVLKKDMPAFKNCTATCWIIINEIAGKYYTANSYNGDIPRSSWNPEHYTYQLTEKAAKKLDKKAEEMIEVEVTDWPSWIVNATPKKTRKTK